MIHPYGFHNLLDRFAERASTTTNLPLVNTAVAAALDAHERLTTRNIDIFSFQSATPSREYENPLEYGELQPLDEHARALPERSITPDRYTSGVPLYLAGTAIGETWLLRREQTIQQIATTLGNALRKDANWRTRQMFAGMLQADNFTFFDKYGAGEVTARPFANGDAITYAVNSDVGTKTDNHLLGQVAAITDAANPLPALANTIREHPENTGDVLIFASTSQLPAIRNLSLFYAVADPNITAALTNARLTGSVPTTPVGKVVGYVGGDTQAWIVQWDRLNTVGTGNYLLALSNGGPKALVERINPAVVGFGLADERNDYPYYERQYVRMCGFGVWSRTAAAWLQMGSATFTTPTAPTTYAREN